LSFSKQNLIRRYGVFALLVLGFFIVDRLIKIAVLDGFRYNGDCISFIFVLNEGVAFSMFAFFGEYLKWIQVAILAGLSIFVIYEKYILKYPICLSLIFAGGLSNLYDRFIHGGVVDFIYWHCRFDFAIFNFADVIIDVGVVLLLMVIFIEERGAKNEKNSFIK